VSLTIEVSDQLLKRAKKSFLLRNLRKSTSLEKADRSRLPSMSQTGASIM
jgi:hypothetical protein